MCACAMCVEVDVCACACVYPSDNADNIIKVVKVMVLQSCNSHGATAKRVYGDLTRNSRQSKAVSNRELSSCRGATQPSSTDKPVASHSDSFRQHGGVGSSKIDYHQAF
jgi:hypothetical protein